MSVATAIGMNNEKNKRKSGASDNTLNMRRVNFNVAFVVAGITSPPTTLPKHTESRLIGIRNAST